MCPFIDVISYDTFEYRAQDEGARGKEYPELGSLDPIFLKKKKLFIWDFSLIISYFFD